MKLLIGNFEKSDINLTHPIKMESETIDFSRSFFAKAKIGSFEYKLELPALSFFYKDFRPSISGEYDLSFEDIDLTKRFFNIIKDSREFSHNEVFAIECALFEYLFFKASSHKTSNEKNLIDILKNYAFKNSTKINYLFKGDLKEDTKNYHNCTLKLKIGRQSAHLENEAIRTLIKQGCTLRLDANQMLTPLQLKEILKDCEPSSIDYIEEPFKTQRQWSEFSELTNSTYKLGLDENLLSYLCGDFKAQDIGAFIIKPALHLGISGYFSLINDEKYSGIKKVISSSFEQASAFRSLCRLSSLENYPHGLGTYEYLENHKILGIEVIADRIDLI